MITKIHNLINNFIQQYNIPPTELWIGWKEEQELCDYNTLPYSDLRFIPYPFRYGEIKIAGLTLMSANQNSCFRVGITIS